MVQRVTYRRRHSYNTKSNRIKIVKTPGGKLVAQYIKKRAHGPACGDCGTRLPGIPALPAHEYKRLPKYKRTVARAYGGSKCSSCVRERITRAFLIEEHKIVKRVSRGQVDHRVVKNPRNA